MSDSIDVYQEEARAHRSDRAWLSALQTDALAYLNQHGFPTRKQEDWKYSSVDAFVRQPFAVASLGSGLFGGLCDVPLAHHRVELVNGRALGVAALQASLPSGVLVLPLADALGLHEEKIKPYLGRILEQTHAFHALNTAFLQLGVFVYVPKGVQLDAPLVLSHWHDTPEHATYLRHVVVLESESSVEIIEDYQGTSAGVYCTHAITEVFAGAHARIAHYKLQREGASAIHFGHLAVKQAAGSDVNSHLLSVGGAWIRSDATFSLEEPSARCFMNGLYLPTTGQHMDHHTTVQHRVLACSSVQDYKGILSGHSRAVFNGQVIVSKDAQQSSAQQHNKNLLLSVGAEIDTKPQLEIFADDVVCTHGATVGQLDEEALFYLATRGIDGPEARQYLVQAFVAENLQAIPHKALSDWWARLLTLNLDKAT